MIESVTMVAFEGHDIGSFLRRTHFISLDTYPIWMWGPGGGGGGYTWAGSRDPRSIECETRKAER